MLRRFWRVEVLCGGYVSVGCVLVDGVIFCLCVRGGVGVGGIVLIVSISRVTSSATVYWLCRTLDPLLLWFCRRSTFVDATGHWIALQKSRVVRLLRVISGPILILSIFDRALIRRVRAIRCLLSIFAVRSLQRVSLLSVLPSPVTLCSPLRLVGLLLV